MGLMDRLRARVRSTVNGFLYELVADPEPDLDPAVENVEGVTVLSLRFRVTTVARPATTDSAKRESMVYVVYGKNQEDALSRFELMLKEDPTLLEGAKVEQAGFVENGIVHYPDDEVVTVQDGRSVPGTPGPVK